jgi:hypothetical protein
MKEYRNIGMQVNEAVIARGKAEVESRSRINPASEAQRDMQELV